MLAKHYPLIKDYLAFVREEDRRSGSKRLYTTGVQLGDWLALDGVGSQSRRGGTEETFIASVYYYHGACLTAQAADILGFKKIRQNTLLWHKKSRRQFLTNISLRQEGLPLTHRPRTSSV